jgi:hypothetical protein
VPSLIIRFFIYVSFSTYELCCYYISTPYSCFSAMNLQNKRVASFQSAPLPSECCLAGFAAIANALNLSAPLRTPACVSGNHISGSIRTEGPWRVHDKRYWPGDTFDDHLDFAMRNENLDLLVLKRASAAIDPKVMGAFVRPTPKGIPARRAWYLYEWMTGRPLNIPDDPGVPAVDLLDSSGKQRILPRHTAHRYNQPFTMPPDSQTREAIP